MRFAVRRTSRRGTQTIDLTPLIDIVFNLLIFFLISSTFVQTEGFEIELPKASSEGGEDPGRNVQIAVTVDGAIVLEGKIVTLQELEERLRGFPSERFQETVIVQADQAAAHGRVVEVMDTIRRIGFAQIAIGTVTAN